MQVCRRGIGWIVVELLTLRDYNISDDPAAPYVGSMLSIPHVGAPHVLERRAKIWMDECAQGHEVCRRLGAVDSGDWLPTRLIDCSDPGRVRIIETSKLTNRDGARYVALSYVWGNGSQSDRKSTRLNSSHSGESRMPSSA